MLFPSFYPCICQLFVSYFFSFIQFLIEVLQSYKFCFDKANQVYSFDLEQKKEVWGLRGHEVHMFAVKEELFP